MFLFKNRYKEIVMKCNITTIALRISQLSGRRTKGGKTKMPIGQFSKKRPINNQKTMAIKLIVLYFRLIV
jgi:hypothetical protein